MKDFQTNNVYRWNGYKNGYPPRQWPMSMTSQSSMESVAGASANNFRTTRSNKRMGDDSARNQNERKKPYQPKMSSSKMQVVNVSDIPLTAMQEEVLCLGLTFSPSTRFDFLQP